MRVGGSDYPKASKIFWLNPLGRLAKVFHVSSGTREKFLLHSGRSVNDAK